MLLMLFTTCTAKAATDSGSKSNNLEEKQQKEPLLRSLPLAPSAAGYLKANKKNPGGPSQGLIKVGCLDNIESNCLLLIK